MARPPRPAERNALAAVIGANARARRLARDRRLIDVAAAASITESLLSKIENGLACPSVTTLASLARALGVQPGALFKMPKVAS